MLMRQKEATLKTAMNEIEDLQRQVQKLKIDALEKKTDEEIKLKEKVKEINTL